MKNNPELDAGDQTHDKTVVTPDDAALSDDTVARAPDDLENDDADPTAPSRYIRSRAVIPPDPLIGTLIDERYEVKSKLGAGGMGSVYLVHQLKTEQILVMKVLTLAAAYSEESIERFRREIVLSAKLDHPNVVTVKAAGALDDGRRYLIMELLKGHSLSDEMKKSGPLTPARARKIFSQVAAGLEHAHSRGVIHRDMKPSNIMLVPVEVAGKEVETAKVVDFGIARLSEDDGSARGKTTSSGVVIGTLAYMSPEQCRGPKVDARADIYSLGCSLYAALTGSPPFAGDSGPALMVHHLYDDPPMLPAALMQEDPRLWDIILKAMEKDPDKRYASAAEFKEALEQLGGDVSTVEHLARKLALAKRPGARIWLVGAILLLLLAVPLTVWCCYQATGLSWQVYQAQRRHGALNDQSSDDEKLAANLDLSRAWMGSGNRGQAIDFLTEAAEISRRRVEDSVQQADNISAAPTNAAIAERQLFTQEYSERVRAYAEILLTRAQLYSENGDPTNAKADAEAAFVAIADAVNWFCDRGSNDQSVKVADLACLALKYLIALSPSKQAIVIGAGMDTRDRGGHALRMLGLIYENAHDDKRAHQMYELALQIDEGPLEKMRAQVNLAAVLDRMGEHARALALIELVAKMSSTLNPEPRQTDLLLQAVNVSAGLHDWKAHSVFVNAYNRIVDEYNPGDKSSRGNILLWRAASANGQGHLEDALALMLQALKLFSTAMPVQPLLMATCEVLIADQYDELGHTDDAIAWYKRADATYVDLNLDQFVLARVQILTALGAVYDQHKRYDEAVKVLTLARHLAQTVPASQMSVHPEIPRRLQDAYTLAERHAQH